MGITSAYPGILFNNQETEVIFVHINLIIICLQIFLIYLFSYNFFFIGMLMSRDLPGSMQSQCISFWYYMYEPIVDNTGPNLGKLAVWVRTFDR